MDRLFVILGICALLALASAHVDGMRAQPAFFSLFFEQLMPDFWPGDAIEATPGEAVFV